jgi:hypothetical protein
VDRAIDFPMIFRQHIFLRRMEEEQEEHLLNPKRHGLNTTCELALIYDSLDRKNDAIALLERTIGTIKDHTKSEMFWFSYEYAVAYLCRLYRTRGHMTRYADTLAHIATKPRISPEERAEDYRAVLADFPVGFAEAQGKNQRWACSSIGWSLMALIDYAEDERTAWANMEGLDDVEAERQFAAFGELLREKVRK